MTGQPGDRRLHRLNASVRRGPAGCPGRQVEWSQVTPPCSKEISEQSAHNQRSLVTVQLKFKEFVWIEDIVRLVEDSASCELYSLLKREDEKYVTEKAYARPMFAEDVVRDIAQKLEADPNITWFTVASENFESIHNHNAYAFIEKKNPGIR